MFFLIPVVASVVSGIASASTAAIAAAPIIGGTLPAVTTGAGTVAGAGAAGLAAAIGTSAATDATVSIPDRDTVIIVTNGKLFKVATNLVK